MEIIFKHRYFMLKNNLKELKRMYRPDTPETYSSQQRLSIEMIKGKLWIYAGLSNKNREQFDTGLNKYMEAAEEVLSIDSPVYMVSGQNTNEYSNDEAVRQMGIQARKEYDMYNTYKNMVF